MTQNTLSVCLGYFFQCLKVRGIPVTIVNKLILNVLKHILGYSISMYLSCLENLKVNPNSHVLAYLRGKKKTTFNCSLLNFMKNLVRNNSIHLSIDKSLKVFFYKMGNTQYLNPGQAGRLVFNIVRFIFITFKMQA